MNNLPLLPRFGASCLGASRFGALVCGLLLPASLAFAQVAPVPPAPPTAPTPVPAAPTPVPTPNVQDPRQSDTPGQKSTANAPSTPAAAAPTPTGTPVPKTIEEVTKGFDKTEGLFTIFRKTDNNRQRMLAQVREDQIGPLFLLQSTFASGNAGRLTAGSPARDILWRFKRTPDERLILSVPNIWYRASDPNLKNAVERDFPDAYLDVFPILARDKAKKLMLIDFTDLFAGGVTGLNTALAGGRGGGDNYILDPELSFVETVKNFPTNMVVEGNYHFKRVGPPPAGDSLGGPQADPRSLPVQVTFNLYSLAPGGAASTDYQPRLADPRVGFFVNGQLSAGRVGFESFDDDAATDARVVYINRWNLQKADPSAKMSAPIKPITFYLDVSIPVAYRQAVSEGILSWNRAFEPLGFKNAVVVKDAPANDWDTADMRFNTIRWVASPPTAGSAYAVALLRENPLTGEIINAGINVNANFARVAYSQKLETLNPLPDVTKQPGSVDGLENGVACEVDPDWHDSALRGLETAQALGLPLDNKTYVNDLLREVVAHEFGHILGLRHNFSGSEFLSPAQLANPKVVREEGTTASIMDYVGFNAFGLNQGVPLFSTGPGRYDKWAISYGYTLVTAASPQAEKPFLKPIANRSNEPGLAYQSDELADDLDPTIVRYDLSSDPLSYAEKSFGITRQLLSSLGKRKPATGETYAVFTRRLRGLIRVNARDATLVSRYVGGVINRREVKGEAGEKAPFAPVPLAQQRRALDILAKQIFAPNALAVPQSYLSKTQSDPYDNDPGADTAFPIREDIAAVRVSALVGLFDPARLSRIGNTTWKFPGQTLGFAELFSRTRQAVWGDLSAKTTYSAEQRDLARAHLRLLLNMATDKVPAPADARLTAFGELQTLKKQIEAPRQSSPDAFTRLFFADTARRINAALLKKPE